MYRGEVATSVARLSLQFVACPLEEVEIQVNEIIYVLSPRCRTLVYGSQNIRRRCYQAEKVHVYKHYRLSSNQRLAVCAQVFSRNDRLVQQSRHTVPKH